MQKSIYIFTILIILQKPALSLDKKYVMNINEDSFDIITEFSKNNLGYETWHPKLKTKITLYIPKNNLRKSFL